LHVTHVYSKPRHRLPVDSNPQLGLIGFLLNRCVRGARHGTDHSENFLRRLPEDA
jgi:hypothetical protein